MQGCVGLLFLMFLLSVWQYLLPPLVAVLLLAGVVCAVNGAGSLTGLLVVPRTADRWLRLIDGCSEDPARLRTVGDRFRAWRSAPPRPLWTAAASGALAGASWGAVLAGALLLLLVALGLRNLPWAAVAVLLAGYAAAAARTFVLNEVVRQRPEAHGLDVVAAALRRRGVRGFAHTVTPGGQDVLPVMARPQVAAPDVAPPPSPPALSPQPRFTQTERVRHGRAVRVHAPVPPAVLEADRAARPEPEDSGPPVFLQTLEERDRVGRDSNAPATTPAAASGVDWRARAAVAPRVDTCGSCGRAISFLGGCGCS